MPATFEDHQTLIYLYFSASCHAIHSPFVISDRFHHKYRNNREERFVVTN